MPRAYLRKELAAWAKRFPDKFYEQIFRLLGGNGRDAAPTRRKSSRHTQRISWMPGSLILGLGGYLFL